MKKTFEEIKEELTQEIKALKDEINASKLEYSEALNVEHRYLKRVNGLMIEEIEIRERIEQLKQKEKNLLLAYKEPEPKKAVTYVTKEQVEMLHFILDEYPKLAASLLKDKNITSFAMMDKDDFNTTMTAIRQRQRGLEKCPKSEW